MTALEIFLNVCAIQWKEEMKNELPNYRMRMEEDKLYIRTSSGTYRSLYSIVMEGPSSPLQEKVLKYIHAKCSESVMRFIADQLLHERSVLNTH
jgi:hypothetical protein